MPTAIESRQSLVLVTDAAVQASLALLDRLSGSPDEVRANLLEGVPSLISMYGDASASLAADFYDETRENAGLTGYSAQLIVPDRTETIRNAIAWAAQPLFDGLGAAQSRLAEVVQPEVARPYRETIIGNRRQDPDATGWQRVAKGDACKFCLMLAGRGSVYKEATANFAAHPHCDCTVQPVFYRKVSHPTLGTALQKYDVGPEATPLQYMASARNRTPQQKAILRNYLNAHYPDSPG